jgi:hypothetical protein
MTVPREGLRRTEDCKSRTEDRNKEQYWYAVLKDGSMAEWGE